MNVPPPTLVTADTPDWPPFHPQTGGTLIDVGRNRCSPERFGGRKVVGARSSIEVLRERTRTTTTEESPVQTLEQTIKVKLWDPIRSLELLGRHLGMFRDKVEHGADASLLDAPRRIEGEEDAAK